MDDYGVTDRPGPGPVSGKWSEPPARAALDRPIGVFDSGPTDPAEATRRTELMADSMASYFATHKRGLALNSKRVADALLSFYTVGDCSFASPGHHGTPLQRQRAADWGADLAAAAQPRSSVLPAAVVVETFDAALARIVSGR